jgi:hypothetical protein
MVMVFINLVLIPLAKLQHFLEVNCNSRYIKKATFVALVKFGR